MAANDPLVLVDGSSYLYRAFHALPPLNTSTGQPTGAMRVRINMLRRLQKDYPSSGIAVLFDAKGKTLREDIFAAYKATRQSMPDDLRTLMFGHLLRKNFHESCTAKFEHTEVHVECLSALNWHLDHGNVLREGFNFGFSCLHTIL